MKNRTRSLISRPKLLTCFFPWCLVLLSLSAHSSRPWKAAAQQLNQGIASVTEQGSATASDGGSGVLQRELRKAKVGDVYLTPDVVVSSTIVIDKSVTLRGSREGRPSVFTCTEDITALEISAGQVILDNLIIKGCGNPAIKLNQKELVNGDLNSQELPTEFQATFTNVVLSNNGKAERFRNGGALNIESGWNVTIIDCGFLHNKADIGGAIYSEGSNISVNTAKFENNMALHKGGAIAADISRSSSPSIKRKIVLRVDGSHFSNNSNMMGGADTGFMGQQSDGSPIESNRIFRLQEPTPSGGAVFASRIDSVQMSNVTFSGNLGVTGGGAMYLHSIADTKLQSCKFFSNKAALEGKRQGPASDTVHGGAIYLVSPIGGNFEVSHSEFIENRAGYGGALHIVGLPVFKVNIIMSTFVENEAIHGGGGAFLRSVDTQWVSSIAKLNAGKLGGGVLVTNGGKLFVRRDGQFPENPSVFEDNYAFRGGGIFLYGAAAASVQAATFIGNKALIVGGALAALNGLPDSRIVVSESVFENNSAGKGGGIAIDGCPDIKIIGPAAVGAINVFRKNQALNGGALFYLGSGISRNNLQVAGSLFESSTVHQNISEFVQVSSIAAAVLEVLLQLRIDVETLQLEENQLAYSSMFGVPCAHGCGGAALIDLTGEAATQMTDVKISSSNFSANVAELGGALLVRTDQKGWEPSCPAGTNQLALRNGCKSLLLEDIICTSNTALKAGGAIFASDMRNVYISRSGSTNQTQMVSIEPESMVDFGLSKNYVSEGGYGDEVASDIASLSVTSGRLISGGHASGVPLPKIELEILDWHKQRITGGIPSASIVIDAQSEVVVGGSLTRANSGMAEFGNLTAIANHGRYEILFSDTYRTVQPVAAEFTIRKCFPGEIDKFRFCEKCQQGYFSLNPSEICQACPENAECHGGTSLVPIAGFWHSTPYSTHFHECLVREACSYTLNGVQRDELLGRYYDQNKTPSRNLTSNTEYRQCSEGYESVLCASCSPGYGKLQGKCKKCQSAGTTRFYMFCGALWSLIILGVAIRSALVSFQEMNAVTCFLKEQSNSVRLAESRTSHPVEQLEPIPEMEQDIPRTLGLEQPNSSVLGSREASNIIYDHLFRNTSKRKDKPNPNFDQNLSVSDGDSRRSYQLEGVTQIQHFIAAENLSETLKIWVNYLQVTSLAVMINADWTSYVLKMFAIQDFLAGFSSAEAIASPECAIAKRSELAVSVGGSIIQMSMPIILYMFVAFGISIIFLVRRIKSTFSVTGLTTGLIISMMAVLFFAYIKLSEVFMRGINCINVDAPTSSETYSEFAIAQDMYWAEDTRLQCFRGQHRIVAVFGTMGLFAITIGAPTALCVLMLYLRRHDLLFQPTYMKRFGFLYQAYHINTVYWEVLILLRKASIVAIVVFGRRIGANMQSVLALGILIIALIVQLLLRPYKYNHLNHTESASLIVSIFTIYSGFIFHEAELSNAARAVVTVVVILVNGGIFAFFLVRSLVQFDRYAKSKLLAYKVSIPKNPLARYIKFLSYFVLTSLPEGAREKSDRIVSKCRSYILDWGNDASETREHRTS